MFKDVGLTPYGENLSLSNGQCPHRPMIVVKSDDIAININVASNWGGWLWVTASH
jgi:hypothetical protein